MEESVIVAPPTGQVAAKHFLFGCLLDVCTTVTLKKKKKSLIVIKHISSALNMLCQHSVFP